MPRKTAKIKPFAVVRRDPNGTRTIGQCDTLTMAKAAKSGHKGYVIEKMDFIDHSKWDELNHYRTCQGLAVGVRVPKKTTLINGIKCTLGTCTKCQEPLVRYYGTWTNFSQYKKEGQPS